MSRLTENDTRIGPLTFGRSSWNPLSVMLSSGDGDENRDCCLTVYAFHHVARLKLPAFLKPYAVRHTASSWDAATVARMGRDWYEETFAREYGFMLSDGHLSLHHGPQTHDSSTTKSTSWFLPWTQWHHHRFSYYGYKGELLAEWFDTRKSRRGSSSTWDEQYAFKKTMPKWAFVIRDFDGKVVQVLTHIEQREWTFGEGCFQWLRFFRRNLVRRSLAIEFAEEVGPEKGSWKGGLIGTSIDMLPGELHEAAFQRLCEQEHHAKSRRYKISRVRTDA